MLNNEPEVHRLADGARRGSAKARRKPALIQLGAESDDCCHRVCRPATRAPRRTGTPDPAFGYVLEGEMVFELEGEPERVHQGWEKRSGSREGT